MSRVRPIQVHPNLPERQRFTQGLADCFNADEQVWMCLAPLRRLRRLLLPEQSCRKQKQQDLADFAHAKPPDDAVAIWQVDP